MKHHLIKICIEYTNTLSPQQVAAVDCSDQPIYALSKIIQWNYREFDFPCTLLCHFTLRKNY